MSGGGCSVDVLYELTSAENERDGEVEVEVEVVGVAAVAAVVVVMVPAGSADAGTGPPAGSIFSSALTWSSRVDSESRGIV